MSIYEKLKQVNKPTRFIVKQEGNNVLCDIPEAKLISKAQLIIS